MTLAALDPKTALIVIDLQKGLLSYPTAHPIGDVLARAAELAQAFRRRGLPVVLVNVTGGAPGRTDQPMRMGDPPPGWADLASELSVQPQDHLVTKRAWGAFTGTDLEAWLKGRGVTQVVMAGVATSIGVESTARHAYELGFNVALATDAMTDLSLENHDHSLGRIFPRLGQSTTTQQIIDLLEPTAS